LDGRVVQGDRQLLLVTLGILRCGETAASRWGY